MLIRETFVQGAIDGEPADAAVKDANGKGISNFGFRISDFGFQFSESQGSDLNSHFEIRNPKFKGLVEAPRIELGSKSQRRRTLHA